MKNQQFSHNGELVAPEVAVSVAAPIYSAPTIESVVTFDELQREVFYAGGAGGPSNPLDDGNVVVP